MKKKVLDLKVVGKKCINDHFVLLKLTCDTPLCGILPGQFVEIRIEGNAPTFLRRPISVNFVDEVNNQLWLLIAVVGKGTKWLSSVHTGEKINCILPLGNGFTMPNDPSEEILLIGGGVGVAPLLYFGKKLKDFGAIPTFLLGAKTASDLLEIDLFKTLGNVYITTEDGSLGETGYVTNHSVLHTHHFDKIATCGPKPMMKAVANYAKKVGLACEASLENMMACGLGACLCCVEKTSKGNLCVCKDGPVFDTNNLLW